MDRHTRPSTKRTKPPKELHDLQVQAALRQQKGKSIHEITERIRQMARPETNPKMAASKLRMAKLQDEMHDAQKRGEIKIVRQNESLTK